MRIGKVVETGNREPPVVELNLTMPCPVTSRGLRPSTRGSSGNRTGVKSRLKRVGALTPCFASERKRDGHSS